MSSEDEITIDTNGITLKGKIANDVRPPVKRVAKTADSILRLIDNVVGLPADFISSHLEPFREQYREGYQKIPIKRRIEPTLRIGSSVLKNVAYAAEEPEIQKLFAKLLVSASDTDYADKVHPGYASIVNELTTIDAKVLISFVSRYQRRSLTDQEQPYESQSISNLMRLGLVGWVEREYTPSELDNFVGRRSYSAPRRLEDTPRVVTDLINDIQDLKTSIVRDNVFSKDRQVLRLTEFGYNFIGVVFEKSD
ncbi:Abi-alpha family protein [Vibrio alginolyticus]|nr:DUF4393 domain-containing protein [Vibrio alginolyticus]